MLVTLDIGVTQRSLHGMAMVTEEPQWPVILLFPLISLGIVSFPWGSAPPSLSGGDLCNAEG